MILNPITNELFLDTGILIKKLECPYKIVWKDLEVINKVSRNCSVCDHHILDTAFFNDEELLDRVSKNPATCLKINVNQENLKILPTGYVK
jgi:hypothetical protein